MTAEVKDGGSRIFIHSDRSDVRCESMITSDLADALGKIAVKYGTAEVQCLIVIVPLKDRK